MKHHVVLLASTCMVETFLLGLSVARGDWPNIVLMTVLTGYCVWMFVRGLRRELASAERRGRHHQEMADIRAREREMMSKLIRTL